MNKIMYSICTLVTNQQQYREMVESFEEAGFIDDCEYLTIDNSNSNLYDGYSGSNYFLSASVGRYIIICHQDILINFDNREKLDSIINEMNQKDNHWGVIGNAGGGESLADVFCNVHDRFTQHREENLPQKVVSLDENFLVINREMNVSCSHNLTGFHFYGTDICLQALCKGCHSYVVDFYLSHLGYGEVDGEFYRCKAALISKYQYLLKDRFIRTSCAKMFISHSRLKNKIYNTKLVLKLKTLIDKFV